MTFEGRKIPCWPSQENGSACCLKIAVQFFRSAKIWTLHVSCKIVKVKQADDKDQTKEKPSELCQLLGLAVLRHTWERLLAQAKINNQQKVWQGLPDREMATQGTLALGFLMPRARSGEVDRAEDSHSAMFRGCSDMFWIWLVLANDLQHPMS